MTSFLSQKFNPESVGSKGEAIAQQHYKRLGCHVVAKNLFNNRGRRIGEIDFIALSSSSVHFVEVKTRSSNRFGHGLEAVHPAKQYRLRKLVHLFLLSHPSYRELRPQIDVCLVELSLDKTQFCVTIVPHAVSDLY